MPGSGPVAVTIEESAYYAATQHPGERLMMLFGLPFSNHVVALARKTANVQTLVIARSTAKTGEIGCVSFLDTLAGHRWFLVKATVYTFSAPSVSLRL